MTQLFVVALAFMLSVTACSQKKASNNRSATVVENKRPVGSQALSEPVQTSSPTAGPGMAADPVSPPQSQALPAPGSVKNPPAVPASQPALQSQLVEVAPSPIPSDSEVKSSDALIAKQSDQAKAKAQAPASQALSQATPTVKSAGSAVQAPASQTVSKPEASSRKVNECGPFQANNKDWFPGLPYRETAQPHFTGGVDRQGKATETVRKDPSLGLMFTDGAADSLMDVAVHVAKARSASQQKRDAELALKISDVRMASDKAGSSHIVLQFSYDLGKGEKLPVVLEGERQDRSRIRLHQTKSELNKDFAAVVSCVDQGLGCENALIRVQLLNAEKKISREVQIVHRWGDAQVTLADLELRGANKIQNNAHREMATFLSNSVINICKSELKQVRTSTRRSSTGCVQSQLERTCGRANERTPATSRFLLRTWAVVAGRAGFEFGSQDEGARFVISGPLAITGQRPMAAKLSSEGLNGVSRVDLINNDGGGNLNLQMIFEGKPKSHMRLNITSVFEQVRSDLRGVTGSGGSASNR